MILCLSKSVETESRDSTGTREPLERTPVGVIEAGREQSQVVEPDQPVVAL